MSPLAALVTVFGTGYREVRALLAIPGGKPLATVMLLPFAGIYQSLIATGVLRSFTAAVVVGVVVFGGPASISIAIADLTAKRAQALKLLGVIGAIQVLGAAASAVFATSVEDAIWIDGFTALTAAVLCLIAASVVRDPLPPWVPSLWTVGLGVLCLMVLNALVSLGAGEVTLLVPGDGLATWVWSEATAASTVVVRSVVAALSGLLVVAVSVALSAPLRARLDLCRFRTGCALTLCLVSLELVGAIADAPALETLVTTTLLSLGERADDDE